MGNSLFNLGEDALVSVALVSGLLLHGVPFPAQPYYLTTLPKILGFLLSLFGCWLMLSGLEFSISFRRK